MLESEKLEWKVEKRKVNDLKNWDENPRKISKGEFNRLKDRIISRGFHDVLKIDTDNIVLSGNQRKRALQDLGIEEVFVLVPNRPLTGEERHAIGLESNISDGSWDFNELANFDEGLLMQVGFSSADMEKMFGLDLKEKDDSFYEGNYQAGPHKVICDGNIKIKELVEMLESDTPCVIFTTPKNGEIIISRWEKKTGSQAERLN